MIPLRLRLRNFMSYGNDVPPLDFSQISTACLTGENGHGKSALLDAITWALWGQTRAKSVDEVVRLGQNETEVEFEFDLEGERYRVLRKRSLRTKAGQSALELQGFDAAANRYQAISGNTIRETEAKIVQLLHMTYDTFINSVFILQGRADEFTTRRPGERKRILAEILGLSVFDELEARARSHRNALDQSIQALNLRLQELQQDVARQNELAAAVATHQKALAQVQAELQTAQTRLEQLQHQHQDLTLQHQRAQDLKQRLQRLRQERLDIEQQLATHRRRLSDREAIVAQETAILTGYQALQRLQEEAHIYSRRAQEYADLQQRQSRLQQAIATTRHRLELDHQRAAQELQTTTDQLQACEAIVQDAPRILQAQDELQALRQRQAELAQALQRRYELEQEKQQVELRIQQKRHALELEQRSLLDRQHDWQQKEATLDTWQHQVETALQQLAEVEQGAQRLDQVRATGVSLKVQIETHIPQTLQSLQQEIQEHQDKQALLETAAAQCPLCEQPLSDRDRQRVIRKLAQEIARREARIRQLQQEQQRLRQQRQALRTEYKTLEQQLEQRRQLERRYATAQAHLDEAKRARDELTRILTALQELDAQLASKGYAADDFRYLQKLNAEVDSLAYDPQEHEAVQQQVDSLSSREVDRGRLEQAQADRDRLQARQQELAQQVARLEQALQNRQFALAEQAELRTLETDLSQLDFDSAHFDELRQQLQAHQHFQRQYLELETARQHLADERATVQALEARLQRCDTDIAALETDLQHYSAAVTAVDALQTALAEAQTRVQHLRHQEGEIRLALGRTQSQYEHCLQRQADLQRLLAQRDQTAEERRLYGDLTQIFGKNGIQAIIIENAIPELEDEANRILSRVTDNAMHLTLETQRDTRSGDVAETLDIKISDALGTRNYELFSGGEAFRINFALRIALSKMLARRAGARLRTLVIDEGFGTQDSQGLERLVDVIKAIRDDFAKIIVITHLRDLKNAFDTHIEVKKDPILGSFYQVV